MTSAAGTSPPALAVRRGGPSVAVARSLGRAHPVIVFLVVLLGGAAVLAGLTMLLGLLLLHVLLPASGVDLARPDNAFVSSLVRHRDGTLTTLSSIGTTLGGAPLLPILVAVLGLAAAIARRWRVAAFVVFGLICESATYRVTTWVIHRDRPHVPRLDQLPVDASFPSGHTAASVAVYAGLAYLLTSRVRRPAARVALWALALLLPAFVAFSRMYRGMHHPTDVVSGALMGIGALVVVVIACRAAGAVAERR
jgi:membrane-associated phospholipid phosphatase